MFAGTVLPVIAIIIPFTENEPVGVINGAKLALLIVNEAVVKLVVFTVAVNNLSYILDVIVTTGVNSFCKTLK